MKTSRIIFISFFSIVGIFLLSLLIQHNNYKGKKAASMIQKRSALPPISHVVIKNGNNIHLTSAVSDSLSIGFVYDTSIVLPSYIIREDSLIIESSIEAKDCAIYLECTNVSTIQISNARLYIEKYSYSQLLIEGQNSYVNMRNCNCTGKLSANMQQQSELICDKKNLNELQLVLRNSKSYIYANKIEVLNADLESSSELTTNKVLKTEIISDESSRYYSR